MGGSFGGMMMRHAIALGYSCSGGVEIRQKAKPKRTLKEWEKVFQFDRELVAIKDRRSKAQVLAVCEFKKGIECHKLAKHFKCDTIRDYLKRAAK